MSRLILSLLLLFLLPVNAMAVEINDKGAQILKSSFQDMLDYQKEVNEIFGSVIVNYEGELNVSQEDGFYIVTFPRIKIEGSNNNSDNSIFDIGVIKINMMPDDNTGYWKSILSLPPQMIMTNKESGDDFIIKLGKQNIIAMFNEKLGYFTKLDLNLSEIKFNDGEKDLGIGLGGLQLYINSEEGENGKFSGPGFLTAKNLTITDEEKGNSAKIGELRFDFAMKNVAYPTLMEYKEKLLKHSKTFEKLNKIKDDNELEAVNGKDVMDMIFDLYNFDIEGFSAKYSVKDLEIIPSATDENKEFDNLKLGLAYLGFGFDGIGQEKGSLQINTGFDGIDVSPMEEEMAKTMPDSLKIDIKALDIPYETLTKIAQSSVQTLAENPQNAQMIGISLLMRLPAILSQAGTQVVIENNEIKNDIYNITLDGKVVTDLTSIMGFSAKFKTLFTGLDTLLSIANKYASDKENKYSSNFAGMAKTLENFKSLGQKEGESYIYEFEATPEGKFLLNGQDTSTISFDNKEKKHELKTIKFE